MDLLTPEQNNQLNSWASQRDAILLEISTNRSENEKLVLSNKSLSISSAEIAEKIQQSIGRLAELDKKEEERVNLLRADIVGLEVKKSNLQTEISALSSDILAGIQEKMRLIKDIDMLMEIRAILSDSRNFIDMIMGKVTTSVAADMNNLDQAISSVMASVKEILGLSTKNISAHTAVLDEIPKLFVELRRVSLERDIINKHRG